MVQPASRMASTRPAVVTSFITNLHKEACRKSGPDWPVSPASTPACHMRAGCRRDGACPVRQAVVGPPGGWAETMASKSTQPVEASGTRHCQVRGAIAAHPGGRPGASRDKRSTACLVGRGNSSWGKPTASGVPGRGECSRGGAWAGMPGPFSSRPSDSSTAISDKFVHAQGTLGLFAWSTA